MIKPIEAKSILIRCGDPNGWFGARYNMNIYRGCEHHCIYCDSRSDCYRIANFDGELLVKANAIELLHKELRRLRVKGVVGTGAMHDPYTPSEAELRMTERALQALAEYEYPVHITTKSDLVLRDLPLLEQINRQRASVCLTVTTADDDLARKLEPGAPSPSRRLSAARELSDRGIQVGVLLMPVLPFIEDSIDNLEHVMRRCSESGVQFVVPCFGVTQRAGQREWFHRKLDALFPGVRSMYERAYGDRYVCRSPNADALGSRFEELTRQYGFETTVRPWVPRGGLFADESPSKPGAS